MYLIISRRHYIINEESRLRVTFSRAHSPGALVPFAPLGAFRLLHGRTVQGDVMNKKMKRIRKVYPWYWAFEGDLLFYIAVDTLFLTAVKNFSQAQIVSLASVSTFVCILLQFPILGIIRKIGNTASVRYGGFCLLLSAVLITAGPNYWVVVLGRVFHEVAGIFRSASVVALENCLDNTGDRDDFVKIRARGNTIYAIITMLISFVASLMFNYNHYLPMIGCITTCLIGFVLSFFIVDHTKYNKLNYNQNKKVKIQYNKFVILAIAAFGLFYPVVTSGQSEGKLFIQQNLLAELSLDDTSLIIGAILCVSRIVRVVSNILLVRIYEKCRAKMGILLTFSLGLSIAFLLFGSFITPLFIKIIIMALGYVIILFIRDPFKLYIQDILFDYTPKEQHQTLLTLMEFAVKIGTAGTGFIFTLVLLKYSLTVVMAISLFVAIVEIVLSLWLYKLIIQYKIKVP